MQNRSSHNFSSFNITYKIIFDLFQDSADVVEEKNPLSLPDLIQVETKSVSYFHPTHIGLFVKQVKPNLHLGSNDK